jgi:hypothetical protein
MKNYIYKKTEIILFSLLFFCVLSWSRNENFKTDDDSPRNPQDLGFS